MANPPFQARFSRKFFSGVQKIPEIEKKFFVEKIPFRRGPRGGGQILSSREGTRVGTQIKPHEAYFNALKKFLAYGATRRRQSGRKGPKSLIRSFLVFFWLIFLPKKFFWAPKIAKISILSKIFFQKNLIFDLRCQKSGQNGQKRCFRPFSGSKALL